MKFKLENDLQATLERVEELMFSEKYYEYLMKNHSGVDTIEVVEQSMDADRVRREVKYTPKPIIRKVGPKQIPREALEFTEHSTYDRKRHILEFENVPRVGLVRKYLTNKGTMTFIQRGSMTPTFESAAFSLQVGELSGPVETPFGYHILLRTE